MTIKSQPSMIEASSTLTTSASYAAQYLNHRVSQYHSKFVHYRSSFSGAKYAGSAIPNIPHGRPLCAIYCEIDADVGEDSRWGHQQPWKDGRDGRCAM